MILLWILLLLMAILGVGAVGLARMYRNPKSPHRSTPAEAGIAFEEVRFPTKNNRQLYGWWMPAKTDPAGTAPTLVLVHGWGRNLERVMEYIQNLHPRGFNLLAFDSRNHGSSDPDKFSSMLKFAEDIMAAVDFVENRPQVNPGQIGVVGLSIGGAATIYAAAHDPRIKAAVTVGAFAHPVDLMWPEFAKRHIPAPLISILFKYFQWRIGATFDEIAPENNIARAHAKFLIIHGDQDTVVALEQAKKLEQAANPESAQLWVLPGKNHSDCHTQPGFWERVGGFLEQTLHATEEEAKAE